jgi:hypothetical protein
LSGAHVVCEPLGPIRLEVRLVQEADINAVLTVSVSIPASCREHHQRSNKPAARLSPFRLSRHSHTQLEGDDGFEESSRARVPCWEGGSRGEKTACQLFTDLGGKVLREIGDHFER